MSQEHINYGTAPNDGTGDTLRESQRKAESNFNELYAAVGSSGLVPSLFGTFKFIRKGFGNADLEIYEVGDLFEGGVSEGVYASLASWNGGVLTDPENFTIISIIEF